MLEWSIKSRSKLLRFTCSRFTEYPLLFREALSSAATTIKGDYLFGQEQVELVEN